MQIFFWIILGLFQVEAEKRREEQRNFGVFFDDDYDYLQHLKESSGPSELVASGPSHFDHQTVKLHDEDAENEEDNSDSAIPVTQIFINKSKYDNHLSLSIYRL